METILFYFFAGFMVISSLMVITVNNPVRAAFFLVLTFFASAVVWLLLEAEFLAVILIIVYVGAVMVLFLFVVMMLDINIAELKAGFVKNLPIAIIVALTMFGTIYYVVGGGVFGVESFKPPTPHTAEYSNILELGKVIYTEYVFAFEIAAVILLVGIIAAISLTLRRRPNTKHQKIEDQVAVKSTDRLRVVKVESQARKGSR
ncbi:NADH-quinone oxidoreductase subunit J [sulfur-oxidizing endosymbiont of Gigantopelta aegis]|uniref:NADH-quinone oxidoreductase subunit J n=1 Tax=sulfur-oxidizing endosymbiont of Gigantopelta aegis TaxID=2794934 RepID=UPI0018DB2F61|nr:NADH-quinone oxidoreductase subunit J [sulfur-oxidizing endosymbiont of Gigantopelta aegis]